MIAATQQKVVAVDPYIVNLAYIRKSTDLHGTSERVKLIQNAVNDEKISLYPWVQIPTNEGYVVFLTEEEAASKPAYQIGMPVSSVTFEEILETIPEETVVLKIDIEGAECKVLTKYLHTKTKRKYIPFIFMEWRHVGINNFGLCPHIDKLLEGFEISGYYPSTISLPHPVKLNSTTHQEWDDVLWIHKDARIG